MGNIRVMVVDDEPPIADMVEIMVNRLTGFHVVAKAYNGRDALKVYKDTLPDVLICDIKMPYKSGLELAKEIDATFSNINIIIMSGYSDFKYAKEAIKLNVWDYLLKPIDEKEIVVILDKISKKIHKAESEASQIFGTNQYKNAVLEIELKKELFRIITNIDKSNFTHIEQSLMVVFSKLEKAKATIYTLHEILSALSIVFGISLNELLIGANDYKALIPNLMFAIKKACQSEVSLSAKEIVDLLEYQIKDNFSDKFDGKEIFEKFGYNEVYLINLFKKQKGITPKQLQKKVRIEKAIELMNENPDILLKTVSEIIGYNDQLYFSKIFKDAIGKSPQQYINEIRNQI